MDPFLVGIAFLATASAAPTDPIVLLNTLNGQQRWTELEQRSRAYADEAVKQKDWKQAGRTLYYTCRALFMRSQYARALDAALAGRDHSLRANDYAGAAYNSFGIGMVHLSASSYELGIETGRQMMQYAAQAGLRNTGELGILQATLLTGAGQTDEALALLRTLYEQAERRGEVNLIIATLGRIGVLLQSRSAEEAEPYLLEAFRLTKLLQPRTLGIAYVNLARLRLQQQRPQEALRLCDLALRHAGEGLRPHLLYLAKAQAYRKMGRRESSLDALRQAIRLARLVRSNIPFSDEMQVSGENTLQQIYELFAVTAAEMYRENPGAPLAFEAFDAVQENRAVSLRARAGADEAWREQLPDEYWKGLEELRRLGAGLVTASDPEGKSTERIRQLRARLSELESLAGLPNAFHLESVGSLARLQARLQPGEQLIGFLLAEPRSLRWVINRRTIQLDTIAGGSAISALTKQFRGEVESNSPMHRTTGQRLATALFEGVEARGFWTIIPDDTLFTIPMPALSYQTNGKWQYLIEKCGIRLAPTAAFLFQPRQQRSAFLGIADPIVNRADPRAARFPIRERAPELPRLPASVDEVRRCRTVWPEGALLFGSDASLDTLRRKLETRPRVLHFATHVYLPPSSTSPVIALGYNQTGDWNVLTDRDIAVLGGAPELVTLSGCGSGRGALAPGTGLLGLTRAWLMAGTGAVMATLWEVPDGGATFMETYYREMLGSKLPVPSQKAAYALQLTQRRQVATTPLAVWAAYFVIGAI